MEEGALRPGTPLAAPVTALGTPELPVTPVRTHSPITPVTPFSHSYNVFPKHIQQQLLVYSKERVQQSP